MAGSKPIVDGQSSFIAGPFDIPKPGQCQVEVTSYFNGPWRQPPEVMAQVGSDGTKLPKATLVLNDPEFPERGAHLKSVTTVTVPPLAPEFQAVEAVKHVKLIVKGKGKAVDSVAEIVQFFSKRGTGFYPGEWTATKIGEATWKVSLPHRWGSEQKVVMTQARKAQIESIEESKSHGPDQVSRVRAKRQYPGESLSHLRRTGQETFRHSIPAVSTGGAGADGPHRTRN